jgi:hypothetical protein
MLNGYCDKINWIPIGPESHNYFINICKNHSIEIGQYDSENIDPHHSNGYKQAVYQRLKDLFVENDLYHLFFEQDHKLYDSIKKKFEQN